MRVYPRLTAARIRAAKPKDHDIWLSDSGGWRGFGQLQIRLTPRGRGRFYFRYTNAGKRRTIALGRFAWSKKPGFLTLSQAKALASQYASSICATRPKAFPDSPTLNEQRTPGPVERTNSDRAEPNQPSQPANHEPAGVLPAAEAVSELTLLQLCDSYVEWLKKMGRSSWKDTRSLSDCYIKKSELASRLARDVNSAQIARLIRHLVDNGKGLTAAKVRSLLHAAYARAVNAELRTTASIDLIDSSIRTNPVTVIDPKELSVFRKARHRKLITAELREFWHRLSIDPAVSNQPLALRALRLDVLLGGQRFAQLRKVEIADIDLDAATVLLMDPKGRRKQPRPHLLPLPSLARAEVEWLVAHSHDCGTSYLLAGRTKAAPLSQTVISRFVRDICRDMVSQGQATSQFQFSDLRRTIETTMASLQVHKDVRAQIQSHGISGVQDTHYDMHDYMAEKRAALELWESYLKSLGKV